jgi:Helix-hairpin-helix domain
VILISMILVLMGAVTLVIGYFNEERTGFIYATIATSLLAALFLVIGILRERSRAKQQALLAAESSQAKDVAGTVELEDTGSDESVAPDDPDASVHEVQHEAQMNEINVDEDEHADWWTPEAAGDDRLHGTSRPSPQSNWRDNGYKDVQVEVDEDETPPSLWGNGKPDEWRAQEQDPAPPQAEPVLQRAPSLTESSLAQREAERFFEALRPVRGVGPSKQSDLLTSFKTLRRLRNASVERIAEVPGISTTLAQRIYNELHR